MSVMQRSVCFSKSIDCSEVLTFFYIYVNRKTTSVSMRATHPGGGSTQGYVTSIDSLGDTKKASIKTLSFE